MVEVTIQQFVVFILIFLRVSAVIVVAPITGHLTVPVQAKVALALFLSYVLFPLVVTHTPSINVHLLTLLLIALKEIVVGLLLGFALHLVFIGLQVAGELMAYTMGLSTAQMFDPENMHQMPVLSQLFYLFALLIFVTINGHHYVFESLYLSFAKIPLGGFILLEKSLKTLVELTGLVFVVGIKIGAPVLIAGFLTYFALSILARIMPQANILVVGFPITITVGMLVLVSSVPLVVAVFKKLLVVFETRITEIIMAF
ncbi:MAG: flagellar biosynthetic protein FliR [Bacteroidetes bacterium]|nr:flagellar biosynthetic protein FliR [Bacteroidota bacterium]